MVSEKILRKSFQKVKKQVSQLKSQDKNLKEELEEIKKLMPTQKFIENILRKIIKEETKNLITIEQLDSLIAKNPDVVFMLQHFHDLDDISITKKQFKHFTQKVDQLRNEAAELRNTRKQLKRNLGLETQLRKLNREVKKLRAKHG
jgi:hypothetical protein